VHFASILEIKAPAGKLESEQKTVAVLRCEYGTRYDLGVRGGGLRAVLNLYTGVECLHTGNQGAREAFPLVVYLSERGSNHRFNRRPLTLAGKECGRLIKECLRHASQPTGDRYGHILDPAKGEVNCMFYAAKFATPVMAACCLGPRAAHLWLYAREIWGEGHYSAAKLLARHAQGNKFARSLRQLLYNLLAGYVIVLLAYFLASISTLDASLDTNNDKRLSWAEWMGSLANLLSLCAILALSTGWMLMSDYVSPVQLGIFFTMWKAAFGVRDKRFGAFIKAAFVTNLCLMFTWPIGPLLFRVVSDAKTVGLWLKKGVVWTAETSRENGIEIEADDRHWIEDAPWLKPLYGLVAWRRAGYAQSKSQKGVNELSGIVMHRFRSVWCCALFPLYSLLQGLLAHYDSILSTWRRFTGVVRPLLKTLIYLPFPQSIFEWRFGSIASSMAAWYLWRVAIALCWVFCLWVRYMRVNEIPAIESFEKQVRDAMARKDKEMKARSQK